MEAIYRDFALNLRRWRKDRGLSQAQLTERTGISRATIASIEGARQAVLLHQAVSLATALNVQVEQLIQRSDDELEELRGYLGEADLQKIRAMKEGPTS